MDFSTETMLLVTGAMLFISVLASIASSRLGVPALLVFLLIGMLAGSDGPGGIDFDNAWITQFLGVIALAFILFDGGLSTEWRSVKPVVRMGFGLSTIGVLFTAALVGWFASAVLDLSYPEGFLLGAIVSSTDAAAVFSILRSRSVGLKGQLKPLLELESGSNDPMAVLLTYGLIRLMTEPDTALWQLVLIFVQQMIVGGLSGYFLGRGMVYVINRVRLEYEGLYPVLTVSLVLLTYGITTALGGNGFLAVYMAAVILGNSDFIHRRSLIRFHDGLAWLMQITMFLALGLLVFPSRLVGIIPQGLLIAAFLMLVARPVSVFLTLPFSRLGLKEKALVSWVGLRGAVPIVLATFPLVAGLPQADTFFNIVFFIVLTSVALQGTSIPLVAKWLDVDMPLENRPQAPLEFVGSGTSRNDLVEVPVPESSVIVGKQIVELGLPENVLVVLLNRGQEFLVPRGSTIIEAGDTLLVLADKQALDAFCGTVGTCRNP